MDIRPSFLFSFLFLLLTALTSITVALPEPRAYVKWARSIGINSENITISHTPLAGWTVKAARRIRKGDTFL
jgi:hypothetical protein